MNTTTKTICDLFAEQVKKVPNQVALVSQDKKLTFQQLDEQAEQLARRLQLHGFSKGQICAIVSDRSIYTIIGILGILKVGGTYLPLSPSHPDKRNKKILDDSGANLLLGIKELIQGREFPKRYIENNHVIYLDQQPSPDHCPSQDTVSSTEYSSQANNLAYVIYTSGSTGEPKGAMIENRSVVNLVDALNQTILKDYEVPLNIALVAPFIFDPSVQQIFLSLLLGHTLFIVPEDVRLDAKKLIRFYNKHQIDISDGTPAHLKMLCHATLSAEETLCVRHFIIGGEALIPQVVTDFLAKFSNSSPKITNVYGPAECCVDSSSYLVVPSEIEQLGFVPIGNALPNVNLYILNESLQPVTVGETGELCIAGIGVGRGYLAREDLTAKCFVANPFKSGQRLYKTGDLARWLADGKIQFLGRVDRQVKLRGYRIDLGEVETAIFRYSKPNKATRGDNGSSWVRNNMTMQVCEKCLLDSQHPGVTIEDGVCSVCRQYETYKQQVRHYFKSPEDFRALMEEAQKKKNSSYDCLLLYSGGKDSTYVLYRLVEMGFKVLSFTFDNGFISQAAFKNINRITTQLGIDHITSSVANMNAVFLESLRTESTVCSGCFRGLTSISNKLAQEKGINVVITGLSRGQIFDTKLKRLFEAGIYEPQEIEEQLLLHRKMYHSRDDKVSKLLNMAFEESSFGGMYFVDYFRFDNITIPQIKRYLASKDESWKEPKDTGLCSTNCRINDVGIFVHQTERGFHNYAAPLSWDCRLGILSREDGFKELKGKVKSKEVQEILAQIGYQPDDEDARTIQDVAVVLKQKSSGEPFLCAYIVSNANIDTKDLRSYLLKELPEYMVPTCFVLTEALPLNENGKIDLARLPEPEFSVGQQSLEVSPSDETEQRLLELWKEVLDIQNIGINDDFFELGGDSFNATILISMIEQEFNVELSVMDAFKTPTIKQLATLVNGTRPISSSRTTDGLVLLRRGTSKHKHFFLIHDVLGGVESYLDLSQYLTSGLNVWGISAENSENSIYQNLTLEEISSQYIGKIKQIQQEGPYLLGGWSFGGMIAFEAAMQLEQSGDDVGLLTMIESNTPAQHIWKGLYNSCLDSLNQLVTQERLEKRSDAESDISFRVSHSWQEVVDFISNNVQYVEVIKQHIPSEILSTIPRLHEIGRYELISYLKRIMSYLSALSCYTPKGTVASPVLYFKARNSQMVFADNWQAFSSSTINWHDLDGDHYSILKNPSVVDISANLNQLLAKQFSVESQIQ